MVQAIWQYILATWTQRNQHLHQDAVQLSQPNYLQVVRNLYELHPQLPPAVQEALFQCPVDQMLNQSPVFLCSWIKQSQCYIQQQLQAAKNMQNSTLLIFIHFSNMSHHQQMISTHHRNPYQHAPVWVFCVRLSHRVITLKKQVFCFSFLLFLSKEQHLYLFCMVNILCYCTQVNCSLLLLSWLLFLFLFCYSFKKHQFWHPWPSQSTKIDCCFCFLLFSSGAPSEKGFSAADCCFCFCFVFLSLR